jgi:hypothetical protein
VISALQTSRDLRASTTRTDPGALDDGAPRVSDVMRAWASVALGHAAGALQRSEPGGNGWALTVALARVIDMSANARRALVRRAALTPAVDPRGA